MSYGEMSPLSSVADDDLSRRPAQDLVAEIRLFRTALRYCLAQQGDDHCWMDYRHLLMRFSPGYNPATDDVVLDIEQEKNCRSFIRCWQEGKDWDCLGGDRGKSVPARSIGTLDCLDGRPLT